MLVNFEKSITLTINERSELEDQLEAAVTGLYASARALNQGILVTRLSADLFTVTLSADVPYGITVENAVW